MKTVIRFLLLALCTTTLAGCAAVHITSDPSGAPIFYSETGIAPWKPWPPKSEEGDKTPAWEAVRPEPYVYVRVEQEGYYPVRPVFLDVKMFKRQRVHFILDKTVARQQFEKGLIWFDGEWMTPEERFRREQQKKGLFFHESSGEWVTAKELEKRRADAKRAQGYVPYQGAWVKPDEEGLVEYKGRWMPPEDAETQRVVDRRVRYILASEPTVPLTITRVRPTIRLSPQLWLADLTGHTLEVFLSGPTSQEEIILPYRSVTIQCEPGTHTLVVRESGEVSLPAAVTTINLEPKRMYLWSYRGPHAPPEMPGTEKPAARKDRRDALKP